MNPENSTFVLRRLTEDFPNLVVLFPAGFALFVLGLIVLFKPEHKLRTLIVGLFVVGLFAAVQIPLSFLFKPAFSWMVVLVPLLAVALFYVGMMYRNDCQTIHPAIAAILGLLRCAVYGILAFIFLLPGCQSYETAEQKPQIVMLFDVSGSLGTKDDILEPGQKPESLLTRQEKVIQFLTSNVGADKKPRTSFVERVIEKSPVKMYRFGSLPDEMHILQYGLDDKTLDPSKLAAWLKPDRKDMVIPDSVLEEDREKYRIKLLDLYDSLKTGTNVPGSALQVAKAEAGNLTQAIIIFSDGQSNLGGDESMREFIARAKGAGIHVYTVGVGDYRTPAAIRIDDIQAPRIARPDDKFPVRVPVVGAGLNEEEFQVTLEVQRVKDSSGSPAPGEKRYLLGPKKGKFKGAGDLPQDVVEFEIDVQELKNLRLEDDKDHGLEGEWEFVARVPRHARESYSDPEHISTPPTRVQVQNKELRVLLFAGGPTRDYQFLRTLLFREVQKGRMHLSVYLQTGKVDGVDQDVDSDRLLNHFPDRLGEDDPKDKYSSLNMYDVIIAIDADWTALDKNQIKLVERWVNTDAGGIVFVAGPVNTFFLARQTPELAPLRSLLPVELKDSRLTQLQIGLGIDSTKPHVLNFPPAVKQVEFMKLDENGESPTAGWNEFFYGTAKPDPGKLPKEGFFSYYPVKNIRPDTAVLAEFLGPDSTRLDDPKRSHQPYIATMRYGTGKTVYVGSTESWRLRKHKFAFHERFWIKLARFTASGSTQQKKYGRILMGRKAPTGVIPVEAQIKGLDLMPLPKDFTPQVIVRKLGDLEAKPMLYPLKAKTSQGEWAGWFAGNVKIREPGEYTFEIPIPNSTEKLDHTLEIFQPNLEEVNVRENHKAMYQLATDALPVLNRLDSELRKEIEPVVESESSEFKGEKAETHLFFRLHSADVLTKSLLKLDPKQDRVKGALDDLWDKGADTGMSVNAFPMLWVSPLILGLLALIILWFMGQSVSGLAAMAFAVVVSAGVWVFDLAYRPEWEWLEVDFSFVLIGVVALLGIEWLTRKLLKLA